MKEYQLGEFEEIVLLTVGVLYDEAYGVALKNEIEDRGKRRVSIGALQSTLRRLEKKGFLDSKLGEPDKERGGKPKRFFKITAYGKKALIHSKDVRLGLWDSIPEIALDLKME
ncbi:MAG: helix-turn-helix transcriptional regulator [Reichenbachiella sp.]|uniref:PadR family transcriptional regulator n=1 Tax=Reichenbachiella sp. TaxID=2184521 RepID=UPI003266BAE7